MYNLFIIIHPEYERDRYACDIKYSVSFALRNILLHANFNDMRFVFDHILSRSKLIEMISNMLVLHRRSSRNVFWFAKRRIEHTNIFKNEPHELYTVIYSESPILHLTNYNMHVALMHISTDTKLGYSMLIVLNNWMLM